MHFGTRMAHATYQNSREITSAQEFVALLSQNRKAIKSYRVVIPEIGDEVAPFGGFEIEYSMPRFLGPFDRPSDL